MKTPITKKGLSQHMAYAWWKYLLLAALVIFGVTLIYDMTRYQPPEEKKVQLYVYGYENQDALDAYLEKVRQEQMPDMEEISSLQLTTDSTYGPMQLSVYMGAGEGDIYLLPRDEFVNYADTGAFVNLDDQTELIASLEAHGVALSRGRRSIRVDEGEDPTGIDQEPHLYGIPIEKLPGITQYAWAEDGFLCVFVMNHNDENVMKFLNIFTEDMLKDPAANTGTEAAGSDMPTATDETTETTNQ